MTRDDYLIWTLPALVAFMFVLLWGESRGSRSEFRIVHFVTGPEGRGSASALLMVLGGVLGIWLVWWLAIHDKLPDWLVNTLYTYFGGTGIVKIAASAWTHISNNVMPTADAGQVPKVRKGDDV